MMRIPRLIATAIFFVALQGLSLTAVSAQGTGGGAVITVTVLSGDGAPVQGASVTAVDADALATSQGPETTDMAGRVMLYNFVLGDEVTISAQPPPGTAGIGMTTSIFVSETPMAVTLALSTPPTMPTPTPMPLLSPTPVSAIPPTAAPAPPGTGEAGTGLTVRTVDPDGVAMPGAGYTVYLPDSSSLFALDGDDGASDGVTSFSNLPISAAIAVSQTTSPGDTANAANQTIVLTSFSGANVLTFTNQPLAVPTETPVEPLSQVSIRALLCESEDLTGKTEYTLDADVVAPETCPAATGVTFSFTAPVSAQSVTAAAVGDTVTDATGAATTMLAAGTYDVENNLAGGTTPLTVDGVSVYKLTAVIYLSAGFVTPTPTSPPNAMTPPARQTGDAQITVMVCTNPAQAGSVEFQVGEPGGSLDVTAMTARVVAAIPDGCAPSAAELTIVPFGDPSAEVMAVSVAATGFLVLDDLPSTRDREPHLLTAVASAGTYEAPFDIVPGAMTEIVARVYLGGTTTPPAAGTPEGAVPTPAAPLPTSAAPPSNPGQGTGGYAPRGGSRSGNGVRVTNLPSTGTGAGNAAPMALVALVMTGLISMVALRRRTSR